MEFKHPKKCYRYRTREVEYILGNWVWTFHNFVLLSCNMVLIRCSK